MRIRVSVCNRFSYGVIGYLLVVFVYWAQENPSHPLSEEPFWPIGFHLPSQWLTEKAAKKTDRKADVLVWLPSEHPRFRAMILVPENTDSKHFLEHEPLRMVAKKYEVALVYIRGGFITGIEAFHQKPLETPPDQPDNIFKLLDFLADQTKISAFRYAPWITFGKSSRGEFPFRMAWLYPERTIAGITYHGETPSWPIPSWAKPQDHTILYVCVNGQTEWGGTWYRHTRPALLNYRKVTKWLPHQVLVWGVGHGNYADVHGSPGWGKPVPEGKISVLQVWDYLSSFVDYALQLRLPLDRYPMQETIPLKAVDPASGYLIHPRSIEVLWETEWLPLIEKDGYYCIDGKIIGKDEAPPSSGVGQNNIDLSSLIIPAKSIPQEPYLWIANSELARKWLQFHNVKNKMVSIP